MRLVQEANVLVKNLRKNESTARRLLVSVSNIKYVHLGELP